MKRFRRTCVRFAAGLALLGLPVAASALPLVIDGKPCGSLNKVRNDQGTSVWAIDNCAPLSALVNPPLPTPTPPPPTSCGNAIVDPGEVCDWGDPYTCGGKGSAACVSNCKSCNGVATPTPVPTATPPPLDGECNMGSLPPLAYEGFPGWFGFRKVAIDPGETHGWCVNLQTNTTSWTMSLVDRTGAYQCFYHTVDYVPPAGSGLTAKRWTTEVTSSTATFRTWDGSFLPKGVYKIRLKASASYPNCPMNYEVTARP